MLRSIRWMRAQHFDLVIDLQCLARSGAFAWLAQRKISRRPGRSPRRRARLLRRRRPPRLISHARRGLVFVRAAAARRAGSQKFHLAARTPAIAAEVKRKWPGENFAASRASAIRSSHCIALQPGARWQNKRWPVEHFAELVRLTREKFPRRAACHPRRRQDDHPLGEIISRIAFAGAVPEFVRRNLPAGNGRMAAALRFDGDERHRPDARRRRARQTARRALRPHRTAPHRPLRPARKCLAP